MDKIFSNLHDPSWWFSAFFVAILASVIAGFLKENVSQWLGGLSDGLRKWRERRNEKRDEVIDALISNEVYRQFVIFRFLLSVLGFVLLVILYFSGPLFITTNSEMQEPSIMFPLGFFVLNIFQPLVGLLTIFAGFKVSSRTALISDAFKLFREKHDLPKVP